MREAFFSYFILFLQNQMWPHLKKKSFCAKWSKLSIHYYKLQHLHHMKKKVQIGKDQDKTQSEKDSHSKNRGGKKPK